MKKIVKIFICLSVVFGATTVTNSCSEDFLKPDPLSFYDPDLTFSTESGLRAAMAICDRHLRGYFAADHNEVLTLGTEYLFSELMVAGATDKTAMLSDINVQLVPNFAQSDHHTIDRTNSIWWLWDEVYKGILYANTIIQYADLVEGLNSDVRNQYVGRAYFHRAFRYYNLVFQFGDVPLQTKVHDKPKFNFRRTKRDAILQMLVRDMELAVEWVKEQHRDMAYIGMVTNGACRMLLAKLYLATGEYTKALQQLNVVIEESGFDLIRGTQYGDWNPGGEEQAWPVLRNVIWDMHRAENKLRRDNPEVIMGLVNRGATAEAMVPMQTMRILYPFFFDNQQFMTIEPTPRRALLNIRRQLSNPIRPNPAYNPEFDYMRSIGRGIATWRPTTFQQRGLWRINGVTDPTDLRHSSEHGNWMRMEDLKINNIQSIHFGENLKLNVNINCTDTIRRWYAMPHYKFFLNDPANELNVTGSDGYRGATNGGNADWYLYRLAEAYLLRAEAKFYINPGDPTIADDLNEIRARANCSLFYPRDGSVTIGDIMDERARELYWEEFRNVELTRVSLCLARSGRPDEWGNTYRLEDFDKQEGTDSQGGSYWYQRIINHSFYNKGYDIVIDAANNRPIFTMGKHNIYWPIPEREINANNKAALGQNFGYTGYDPNTPVWDNWQDAVADEDRIE